MIRLPRDYADAALIARMKIRQANADINDLADSVEAAMRATAPVSIHDTVLDSVAENIQNIMEKPCLFIAAGTGRVAGTREAVERRRGR